MDSQIGIPPEQFIIVTAPNGRVHKIPILLYIELILDFMHSSNDLNHDEKYEHIRLYPHSNIKVSPGFGPLGTVYVR